MRSTQPTRLLFHAMFGLAIAIAATGTALGVEARLAQPDVSEGSHRKVDSPGDRAIAATRAVAPPLPIAPRFGAGIAGSPTLSWRLEEGTDGARVELCPTRDFDESTIRRIDVDGEQVTLPAPWPAGFWYWRLRGRDGRVVGDRTTPTWMVYVTDGNGPS